MNRLLFLILIMVLRDAGASKKEGKDSLAKRSTKKTVFFGIIPE